jgi:hypothetical protein
MLLSAGGLTGLFLRRVEEDGGAECRSTRSTRRPPRARGCCERNAPPVSSAKHTARGAAPLWTLGGYGVSQVVRLASSLILARLLFPEAFGLMALVNVFMQGLEMLSDLGHRAEHHPEQARHRAGVPAHGVDPPDHPRLRVVGHHAAAGPPVAAFFAARDPLAAQLTTVLPVAGLMAVLGGFTSTSLFTLNKKMAMGRLTALTLIPQAVSLVVSIVWAFAISRSVWAIVAGGLAQSAVRLVLTHALNPGPRDRLGWDREGRARTGEIRALGSSPAPW